MRLILTFLCALLALAAPPRAYSQTGGSGDVALVGDPAAGKELFLQCQACHQIGEGAAHRIGPHLNGLIGRKAASYDTFHYSPSLSQAGVMGLVWHDETLDRFLENPQGLASGNRMNYRGLRNAQHRRDLIAYLRTFSSDPAADLGAETTTPDDGSDPAIVALQGDAEYGAYLSGECTSCHQASGSSNGIPAIVRWPEADFVRAMQAYKHKARDHPVMQMIAGRLGDDEIAALAAYFHNPDQ